MLEMGELLTSLALNPMCVELNLAIESISFMK